MNRTFLRLGQVALALVLLVWLLPTAHAIFLRPELERVPVDRLAKNLEEAAKKNVDKQGKSILYNLARLHAMAYALKTDTTQALKKRKPGQGAWFGYTPKHVPFKVKKTDDKDEMKAAKEHLEKSIATYEKVLKMDPKYAPARLGHAWAIEQSGKKKEAVGEYRKLLTDAWKTEQNQRFLPLSGNTITIEAGGYLVALLDPKEDKAEIAKLNERITKMKKLPRPITPIVVPLEPNLPVEALEDRTASVRFDADGTGLDRSWTWVTPKAGWLVHDPKRSGKITSAIQMFGNVSFLLFWSNGYEAMSALDDNADGKLTGKELAGLAIWRDANGNGISEPGEVKPLADHGIVGLSCRHQQLRTHRDRIEFSPAGVSFRDGTTRPTFDLVLKPRQ